LVVAAVVVVITPEIPTHSLAAVVCMTPVDSPLLHLQVCPSRSVLAVLAVKAVRHDRVLVVAPEAQHRSALLLLAAAVAEHTTRHTTT
jgi:hypothetical protein